jgi:hypothetical protein
MTAARHRVGVGLRVYVNETAASGTGSTPALSAVPYGLAVNSNILTGPGSSWQTQFSEVWVARNITDSDVAELIAEQRAFYGV